MFTLGLDVSTQQSSLCILDAQGRTYKQLVVPGRWPAVMAAIDRQVPRPFAVGFEASCGYGWLADELGKRADRVVVAHPGQLRLIFAGKKKNDRVDAAKLAKLLYLDLLPAVHVPSVDVRQWRRLIEMRQGLIRDRVVFKNRIRAVLRGNALACPVRHPWSKKGRAWLAGLDLGVGDRLTLDLSLMELTHLTAQVRRVEAELDRIAASHPGVALLMTIPGVGPRTAEAVVAYIDDVRRFTRVRQVGSYFGLVPRQDQSGSVNRLGHITRDGPATVRKLLVEASLMALRHSPTIKARFDRLVGDDPGRRKIAVVATAHYLLRVMTAMLRSGEVWRHEPKRNWMIGRKRKGQEAADGRGVPRPTAKRLLPPGRHRTVNRTVSSAAGRRRSNTGGN